MERNKLYRFVLFLSLAGFVYLFISIYEFNGFLTGCLFHKVTGLPCPACGSTRAVLTFLKGQYTDAFYINPLGLFTLLLAILFPVWILIDIVRKKDSFYRFYQKSEYIIRRKSVAVLLILLFVANWLWNITKDL